MPANWMELNLTPEEDEFVRKAADIHRIAHLDTIDNVFIIAKAIHILHRRYGNSGVRGAFSDALVQYGFRSRDGKAMNKAIVSMLGKMRENEDAVRRWWGDVPERKKRDWHSPKAVYHHWQRSLRPPREQRSPTPLAQERATNVVLQEQLHSAIERLRTADGGNLFDLEHDTAEHVAHAISGAWRASPSKLDTLIKTLTADLREINRLTRTARPARNRSPRRSERGPARDQ
jgi:hypothetical protein